MAQIAPATRLACGACRLAVIGHPGKRRNSVIVQEQAPRHDVPLRNCAAMPRHAAMNRFRSAPVRIGRETNAREPITAGREAGAKSRKCAGSIPQRAGPPLTGERLRPCSKMNAN